MTGSRQLATGQQATNPLRLAPAESVAELNTTFQQYQYLSGMGSETSFAVSCRLFVEEHRCTHDDVNSALRDCRAPERMAGFRFASDLMGYFAERVVHHRANRERMEQQARQRRHDADESKRAIPAHELSQLIGSYAKGIGE